MAERDQVERLPIFLFFTKLFPNVLIRIGKEKKKKPQNRNLKENRESFSPPPLKLEYQRYFF